MPGDIDHANVMVSFEVDLAKVVLVEEVVAHDQAFVVVAERDHVRPRVRAQVDDAALHWVLRVADVEHADLARLEEAEDQPVA